jgi:hypothetical protein
VQPPRRVRARPASGEAVSLPASYRLVSLRDYLGDFARPVPQEEVTCLIEYNDGNRRRQESPFPEPLLIKVGGRVPAADYRDHGGSEPSRTAGEQPGEVSIGQTPVLSHGTNHEAQLFRFKIGDVRPHAAQPVHLPAVTVQPVQLDKPGERARYTPGRSGKGKHAT